MPKSMRLVLDDRPVDLAFESLTIKRARALDAVLGV